MLKLAVAVSGLGLAAAGAAPKLECEGHQKEVKSCSKTPCAETAPVDCEWGEWSAFGPCTCEGLMERHRTVAVQGINGGKPCTGAKVDTESCHPDCRKEPTHCELGEW